MKCRTPCCGPFFCLAMALFFSFRRLHLTSTLVILLNRSQRGRKKREERPVLDIHDKRSAINLEVSVNASLSLLITLSTLSAASYKPSTKWQTDRPLPCFPRRKRATTKSSNKPWKTATGVSRPSAVLGLLMIWKPPVPRARPTFIPSIASITVDCVEKSFATIAPVKEP